MPGKDNKKEQKDTIIKLQIPAGKASPAPPVGPALGGSGVNIMDFVKQFCFFLCHSALSYQIFDGLA